MDHRQTKLYKVLFFLVKLFSLGIMAVAGSSIYICINILLLSVAGYEASEQFIFIIGAIMVIQAIIMALHSLGVYKLTDVSFRLLQLLAGIHLAAFFIITTYF